MENIPIKLDLKQINSDISDKQNNENKFGFSSFKKKNFLSKSQRNKDFPNNYIFNKKDFLKNKRKSKNKIRNEIPDTPHNTGQYLCHIYQENEIKENKENKKQKDNNNNNDDFGINFFEDEDDFADDCLENFELNLNESSKRERLMSLEGKDLENFLYKPEDVKKDKKLFKSAIILDKPENHINIDSGNDDLLIMKDK